MEIEKVSGDYRPLILVAEDDDSNFKLIKAIIGKKCEILWAKNGEDIVNLFEENRDKAEAILMDIKMPIMNGRIYHPVSFFLFLCIVFSLFHLLFYKFDFEIGFFHILLYFRHG